MNTVKDKDRRKRAINNEPYMLKKMLVDQRLLGNRNKIAHGERLETLDGISNANDYIDLHETMSSRKFILQSCFYMRITLSLLIYYLS